MVWLFMNNKLSVCMNLLSLQIEHGNTSDFLGNQKDPKCWLKDKFQKVNLARQIILIQTPSSAFVIGGIQC
jgi:hypothetical protein